MVTKGRNDGLKGIHGDIFECFHVMKNFSFLLEFLMKNYIH